MWKAMKNIILVFVIVLCAFGSACLAAKAQGSFASGYNFTYVTMDHGLQSNFIDDLYKDSRGFLWIATNGGGLSRYDGYDFVQYTTNTPGCKLRSNFTRNICEDALGRLWITSENGIDILDLQYHRLVAPTDPTGEFSTLANQSVLRILCDTKGGIWIFSRPTLFYIELNTGGDIIRVRTLPDITNAGPDIAMADIDADGCIWLGAGNEVNKVTFDNDGNLKMNPVAASLIFDAGTYISSFQLKENEVWVATDRGLYRYHRTRNEIKHYQHEPGNNRSLSQNFLTDLAITTDRQLVVATLRGLNIYNPITDDFEQIADHSTENGKQLNSNFVNCLLIDGDRIWAGTETGGVNKIEPQRLRIRNYVYNKNNPSGLSGNPVNAVYEDAAGALWVGTVEGGLNCKNKNSESFVHYTTDTPVKLSHNSVSALTADNLNRLWIGTWGGGIDLMDLKTPDRILLRISSQTTRQVPIDFVGMLRYDPINQGMWIGANQGIYFYDLQTDQLTSLLDENAAGRLLGCVGSIIDKNGQLWIGSLNGVFVVDLHSRSSGKNMFEYRHLVYKLDHPESKVVEKMTSFCETDDGALWLGSNGYGIYKYVKDATGKEKFVAYTVEDGLPNNSVRGILQDKNGCLWISTNYGLSCYNSEENRFVNYTAEDGLADNQFYWNAFCRSATGTLFFGGVSGLAAIDGKREGADLSPATVCLTRLRVENKPIEPGEQYISEDISTCHTLRFHERDKSFSIEFAALNFDSRNAAMYSYRLVGFDDNWIHVPASRRFASYTNLPAGTYTFQVKYNSADPRQENPVAELQIVVKPFFYKTVWFVVLVMMLIVLGGWQVYQWRIRSLKRQREMLHQTIQERTRELVEQKQLLENQTVELSHQNATLMQQNEKITRQKAQLVQMSRKVQEATIDKLSFFTNITHEFRTPITLIIGPIERALKLSYNPQVIEQLNFVERNSKYLLSLVNQLMDFRKVESGKMDIVKTQGNFLDFTDLLITPFEVFAGERNIVIRRCYRLHSPYILFDEEAMRKVLANLLSNAIKFTPNGGNVTLYVAAFNARETNREELYICVKDSGNGIQEEEISRIFNRFYQSSSAAKYPVYGQAGTGIGLYLCKRIVQLHGGKIAACNNHGAGASFRITMPLQRVTEHGEQEISTSGCLPVSSIESDESDTFNLQTPDKLTLLVVEDNADMRGYIRSILNQQYHVIEAPDGALALSLLNHHPVDFIVSDLMMPVMDGLELSKRVKESFAISHIPFLMLTAKTSDEARLESYRMGVDEYLVKPFDETLLLTRIQNILENRKRYQRKFSIEMDVEALCMEEESSDKKFLNKIMEVMRLNYKNSYFEVGDFTEAMGVSKSLLNKKLQSLTGQSTGQFVRNYRLNIARELILKNRETKNMNVSEIAYEVGFNDPKYFTRCFTRHFNARPSDLLER